MQLTSKSHAGQDGVTLLELLVVIVIMAVIMSVSIPAFTSIGRGAGMRGAVSEVRSTLSLSRQWAITKREPVVFVYGNTTTNAFYAVYAVTNEIAEAANEIDNARLCIQQPASLDLALRFGTAPAVPFESEIKFKTDGALTTGINFTNIIIRHQGGTSDPRTIKIHPLTGGIVVE